MSFVEQVQKWSQKLLEQLIQWYGRSGAEAEVSAYFTPQEWWALGGDGIIWEIQQVYKNFIAALDPYLTQRLILAEQPATREQVSESLFVPVKREPAVVKTV